MQLTSLCCSQPAAAGTAYTPLVPRSVTAAPYKGVEAVEKPKITLQIC